MKEEGTPFNTVMDRVLDTAKVMRIPNRISRVSSREESRVFPAPPATPTKNMEIMAIRVGNRPLQGTKLLVTMAISRSLGESMIRQPTMPAALQPKPMHMVSACLPQAWQHLKGLSRL